ncbi:MAG: alpha/beta hydrolase [Proteobacteria bacterium]|nr:alpha/beta hydrolase [Pseudomonadota bacterium]
MFLDIDGNRVFALSFGKGPRTILAHSGWVGNFEDWIATLAPLSESWRTVVYDHRGTGETSVPVEKISHEAMVDDVFAVMDALKIERCILAGFSRGVMTVMRAVLRDPGRFDGLILMNGTGEVVVPGTVPAPRTAPSRWPGETHRDRLRWFIERCTPEPDSDHIRRWGVNILSRATPEAAERIMTMQWERPVDWATELPRWRLPTLLLHGEKDFACTLDTQRYIQSLIPDSKLVVFEGAGHIPAMARPDEVAAAINEYFTAST